MYARAQIKIHSNPPWKAANVLCFPKHYSRIQLLIHMIDNYGYISTWAIFLPALHYTDATIWNAFKFFKWLPFKIMKIIRKINWGNRLQHRTNVLVFGTSQMEWMNTVNSIVKLARNYWINVEIFVFSIEMPKMNDALRGTRWLNVPVIPFRDLNKNQSRDGA